MKEPKIVEIEWLDTSCLPHWQDEGEIPELIKCHTVGYFLRETKKDLTLAFAYSQDGGTISPMTVPKVNITKRRLIR